MNSIYSRASSTFAAGFACTLLACGAYAQESATLEEIVVTAQKRAENVQDVPIAITALGAAALAEKGITNVTQVSDFSPNIQIDRASPFAGSSTIVSAFVRGIGQNDFAFNMEPGVGLYVDGVYLARTVGAAIDLLDVERVEILKGPQGTLFGRNTIGGAIHVITRKPDTDFSYSADVTLGGYDRIDVRGAMDIPLIDGLLYSSVSFSSTERDGFQKRRAFDSAAVTAVNPITGAAYTQGTYGTDNDGFVRAKSDFSDSSKQGGESSQTGRLKLLFTPSDNFEFLLAGDVTVANEESTSSKLLDTYLSPDTLFGLVYNACIGGLDPGVATGGALPPGMCSIPRGTVGTSLASVAANRLPYGDHFVTDDIDTTYATGSNFSDVQTWGVSGTAEWTISDALSLRSITAYRELDSKFGMDLDGGPEAYLDTSFLMEQEQFSEELQLNINAFDERLKSVVGAYYFTEEGGLLDTVTFGGGLLQVFGPNDLKNDASALFTHNNFQLTDRLGLTFGARYTRETKYFTGGQSDLNNFVNAYLGVPAVAFPDPSDTRLLFPTGRNKLEFSDTSYRAGFEFSFTPDILGYVSYAEGYKSGGWTTRLAVPLTVSAGAGAPVDPSAPPQHDPEKATTYEAGLKSELFGRTMRLNAAVFWTDYEDMQIVAAPAFAFGAPWFFNAGEARIRGAELEIDARVTTDLALNASVGYLDAEYRKLDAVALAGGLTLDHELMNVPELSATAGGTYTFHLPNDAGLSLHADYSFKDEMARDASNTPLLISDSLGIVNATLTYEPADGPWQITLGGENLTDERYIVTGNNNPGLGVISATYNRPRTWYLSFKIRN